MIKPTVPRQTRMIDEQDVVHEKVTLAKDQTNFAEELSPAEEEKMVFTAEQKKEILKLFTEEPKFSSKRKQELKRLLETPVFTETVIRFKLPDGKLIESHFSPIEKVKDLRAELEKVALV